MPCILLVIVSCVQLTVILEVLSLIIDNIRILWIGNAHKNLLFDHPCYGAPICFSILFVFTPAAVLLLVVNFQLLNGVWEYR